MSSLQRISDVRNGLAGGQKGQGGLQEGRGGERSEGQGVVFPRHIEQFLSILQTHFETPRDQREWDAHDTRAYGRLVIGLTGPQCRELIDRLRAKHHWRPSVAQVQELLSELIEPAAPKPAHELAARTLVTAPKGFKNEPKGLPSTGEGPGRDRLRAVLDQKRRTLGQAPAQRPDTARFGEMEVS